MGHETVGTEHLLLALSNQDRPANLLAQFNIRHIDLLDAVNEFRERGELLSTANMMKPFSSNAKHALDVAYQNRKNDYELSSMDIFYAIIEMPCRAVTILKKLGMFG